MGEECDSMARRCPTCRSSRIKIATKTQQKRIVRNAKKLMEDPILVLPKCSNQSCELRCYFKKLEKKIKKIWENRDDEKKLVKYSKKKGLPSAVAGALLLANSEKAPYLAMADIFNKKVAYAKRGNAGEEKLIATQNLHDPRLLLLGIMDIASKKGMSVFSTSEGMFCTGDDPSPPNKFLNFLKKELGLKGTNVWTCEHLNETDIKKRKKEHLRIDWKSAGITIGICRECASNKNTSAIIHQYFYSPEKLDASVVMDVVSCNNECDECLIKEELEREAMVDEYLNNGISDGEFIDGHSRKAMERIKKSGKRVFLMDKKCYGNNSEKFINALNPNGMERSALSQILEKVDEAVVVSDATPNKVLEKYWENYGKDILEKIVGGDAKKFLTDEPPSIILKRASKEAKKKKIISKLPTYQSLPPIAKFADKIARTFKTKGEKEAVKVIEGARDTKKKAVGYSFLLAFGHKGKEWKYSKVEKELARSIQKYAKEILEAQQEEYHEALQKLVSASGAMEKI